MSVTTTTKVTLPTELNGRPVKAFITWAGLELNNPAISVVSLVFAYMQEVAKLSCGECSLGYNGMRLLCGTLERLTAGQGSESDLQFISDLAEGIHANAACDFCRQGVKPVIDSLSTYKAGYQEALQGRAALPKVEHLTHVTAPCMEACPIHQDIPGYIELTRHRRYDEALEVIRSTNCLPGILGRACVAFCEKNCVRGTIDQPLAIRALKRVSADYGLTKYARNNDDKKDKVAVIGCGPAGMTAADYLAHRGYQVYLIDEQAEPGGMAAAGIPPYRLPRRVIKGEFDIIKNSGVQYKPATRITHAGELMMNVKAVLVASGAHQSKDAGITGWNPEYRGCLEGVKYLRLANTGQETPPAERVIVVGGGNTAIDCARTALRLGAKEVTVVYRRSRAEMPAHADEVEAAEKEGIKFHFLALPVRLVTQGDVVTGAECQRMELGEPDASGRRRPVAVVGSEFIIPAELVLTAIGEQPELSFLPKDKIEFTDWGSIKADTEGRTSLPWLFTAGDCATGPATIVEAMAGAKKAACSLDRYLSKSKEPDEKPLSELLHELALGRQRSGALPTTKARRRPQEINIKDRLATFDEVEECFTPDTATKEASRCLRCYRVMVAVT